MAGKAIGMGGWGRSSQRGLFRPSHGCWLPDAGCSRGGRSSQESSWETDRLGEAELVRVETEKSFRPGQSGVGHMQDVERAMSARQSVHGGNPSGLGDNLIERDAAMPPAAGP